MVSAAPTARFSLIDHDGREVTEADFADAFLLVYFGFTHCRVVCPRSLAKLSNVLNRLAADADKIRALYITVDPERDSPEVMKSYLKTRYPRFTGLTGSREQIEAAKRNFRVFAERKADAEDPDGYIVPHTAISYLMAPSGEYLAHFTDALEEDDLTLRIVPLIRADRTPRGG